MVLRVPMGRLLYPQEPSAIRYKFNLVLISIDHMGPHITVRENHRERNPG